MASSENQQHIPNPAPPFSSAGDHEMRDYYAAQDASRPPSQQEPYLTPYLGLRARLSQASSAMEHTCPRTVHAKIFTYLFFRVTLIGGRSYYYSY
jgi:hypothetical protein